MQGSTPIHPTSDGFGIEDPNHYKVFELIVQHFVATFLPNATTRYVTVKMDMATKPFPVRGTR